MFIYTVESLEQHERLTNTCEHWHTRSLFTRIQQRLALARTFAFGRTVSLVIYFGENE